MRILVTGGTGQIGGAIVRALTERGDSVRVLVRGQSRPGHMEGFELFEGDVTDSESLKGACEGIEAVVHAAGVVSYWKRGHQRMREVHVDGTRNLLEAASLAGVQRFVHTSSMACFGYLEGDDVGNESTEYNWGPLNIGYCDTKKAAEDLVLSWSDMPCIAVNPGVTLGEGDVNGNGLRLFTQLKAGKLRGIPPGATTLCDLRDVVRGHLAALELGQPGERYHLGGHPLPWDAIFERVARVVGVEPLVKKVTRGQVRTFARLNLIWGSLRGIEPKVTPQLVEMSTRNRQYECSKAKRELNYTVSDLEESLNLIWDWHCRVHSI